ncbi:Facilitated trehalose transporter Tret1, partial [Pseudolycoriella hygida]
MINISMLKIKSNKKAIQKTEVTNTQNTPKKRKSHDEDEVSHNKKSKQSNDSSDSDDEAHEPTLQEVDDSFKPENMKNIETVRQKKRTKHQKIVEVSKQSALKRETSRNIEYLNKWKSSRETWKFEKLRQISIQNHFGSKGAAREYILKKSQEIIDDIDNRLNDTNRKQLLSQKNYLKMGNPRLNQTIVALSANIGALMFGLALGWSAPTSMKMIEKEDYKLIINGVQFGWIVAMMPLGGACSCIFSGILRKYIGTKLTFFVFGFPIVLGYVLLAISSNLSMLMAGRFLIGVSMGCYVYLLPMYVGELASKEIRGALGSLLQIMINTGVLFVFILGHFTSVLVLNIVCGVIPIIFSVGFLFLPETPAMLVTKNKMSDAIISTKFFRGENFDHHKEISEQVAQNQQQRKNFKEIFNVKSTRRAFTIMMILFVFFQMSGINVLLFYSTIIFTEANVALDAGISSMIVAAVQLTATFLATSFVDRFGRKILLVSSYVIICFSLFGISFYFLLNEKGNGVDSISWLPLVSFSAFLIAFSYGMAPVTYILLGEVFSQDAKFYIASTCQVLSFLLTFLLGLFFPMLVDAIKFGYTFLIFAICTFVGTLFVIFFVPETKGKSLSEIQ